MVEEHYHEAAGTSYSDAQASGFEVLPDDVVIKSFLQKRDSSEGAEVKPCHVSQTCSWHTQPSSHTPNPM